MDFEHGRHPWVSARTDAGPVRTADQHPAAGPVQRFNTRLALWTTRIVGTMWCAYAFAVLDLLALPEAVRGGLFGVVQWTASFFLQLVLLSIIMVGQNVQAQASDKRAEQTFDDVTAILHESDRIAVHLAVQDELLHALSDQISALALTMRTDRSAAGGIELPAPASVPAHEADAGGRNGDDRPGGDLERDLEQQHGEVEADGDGQAPQRQP